MGLIGITDLGDSKHYYELVAVERDTATVQIVSTLDKDAVVTPTLTVSLDPTLATGETVYNLTQYGIDTNGIRSWRAKAIGLAPGTKYYYRIYWKDADGIITGDIKSFRSVPLPGSHFRFAILADSHWGFGSGPFNGGTWMAHDTLGIKDGSIEWEDRVDTNLRNIYNYTKAGAVGAKAAIDAISGGIDFIIFLGDEYDALWNYPLATFSSGDITQSEMDEHFVKMCLPMYQLFGDRPCFFTPGNHEEDRNFYGLTPIGYGQFPFPHGEMAAYTGPPNWAQTIRGIFLPHPSNGELARYAYTDYGDVRLITLTPYAYCENYNDCDPALGYETMFNLGTVQSQFLSNAALDLGRPKFTMSFLHQLLEGTPLILNGVVTTSNYCWSPAIYGRTGYSNINFYQRGGNIDLFAPLRSNRDFVFYGHSHLYCREQLPNGTLVYSCPSAGSGPGGITAGNPVGTGLGNDATYNGFARVYDPSNSYANNDYWGGTGDVDHDGCGVLVIDVTDRVVTTQVLALHTVTGTIIGTRISQIPKRVYTYSSEPFIIR